jgi:hypothetical protein
LVEEAVRAIGALAGRLSWTAYYRLVNAVLKPIPTHPNQQVGVRGCGLLLLSA